VRTIELELGRIDVAVYAPVPGDSSFAPAASVNAEALRPLANIYTFAPIELSHALLPGMLDRGDGAIVVVGGASAVTPMPGMGGGIGAAMAAARNFIHTLNGEVKDRGVYAGTVYIGAMIARSAGYRIATAGGAALDPRFPIIDPDEIAHAILAQVTERDRVEVLLPHPAPRAA
jgi:short-subunit dehydrogenase